MPRKPRLTRVKKKRTTGQSRNSISSGTSTPLSLPNENQNGIHLQTSQMSRPSQGNRKRKSDAVISVDTSVPYVVPSTSTVTVSDNPAGPSSKKISLVYEGDIDRSSGSITHSPVHFMVKAQIHNPPSSNGNYNQQVVESHTANPVKRIKPQIDWDAIVEDMLDQVPNLNVPAVIADVSSPVLVAELSPIENEDIPLPDNPVIPIENGDIPLLDNPVIPQENVAELQDLPVNNLQVAVPLEDIEALLLDAYLEQHRVGQIQTYLRATERRSEISFIGPFTMVCAHCSALYFSNERNARGRYTGCCSVGNVSLPILTPLPDLFRQLFDGTHPQSRLFKLHVQQYNNAFQFVSYEATLRALPAGRAPPVYAIQGKVYHHISDVDMADPNQRYGPIFFLDPEDAVDRRFQNHNNLDRVLINRLEVVLRDVNPFARSYFHLRECFDIELDNIIRLRQNAADQNNLPPIEMPDVTLELLSVRGNQNRMYDVPAFNEVAAIYRVFDDTPPTPNLRIYVRDGPTRFRTIKYDSEILDPMVFPLLFPGGDIGWHFQIQHVDGRRKVTLCEFYAYRLAYRDGERRFYYGGKMTQLYIVAAYIKVEADRLNFIRLNQEKLRADEYIGLADFLNRRANNDEEGFNLGKMIILPSSFIGSPRSQMQRFQDATALVVEYGHPSLFITVTTNPKWREIVDNIPQGHQANDHAMLVCRVFKKKLDLLISEIIQGRIFGVVLCLVYVIEFQKRGLPHSHILITLCRNDRIVDPFLIDTFISAELPDREQEPELFDIVSRHMLHGPCGVLNPRSPCMIDGRCSKKFPKSFVDHTVINENGQVQYRRRNNGRTTIVAVDGADVEVDNSFVVPYNPYLSLRYNCHINVDNCASVRGIKYLYKYFFKGVDSALVRVNVDFTNYDEIQSFLNCRYMTPIEAAWHLNRFPMHFNTHTIYRLCIHLPFKQIVRFQPGFEHIALERHRITQLTGWFILNQNDPDAIQYFYREIPLHYVWNSAQLRWTRRQRGASNVVVRISGVNVRNRELFYLRLLLLHVTGARSYEDVRTVNGQLYDTFYQACQERNLLANDLEFQRALREASIRHMPAVLREMFCYMLMYSEITDKRALWEEFQNEFAEDFLRGDLPQELAIQRALVALQKILNSHGVRLAQFGLPEPVIRVHDNDDIIDIQQERDEAEIMRNQLNQEQLVIYQAVVDAFNQAPGHVGKLFLIDAAAGSGKSYVFRTLITYFRSENVPILTLSSTGIAASLLPGGTTIHHRFKLPFDINETTTLSIQPLSAEGVVIKETKVIFIDEISMVTRLAFNVIERGLRDICSDNRPFANKIVVLGGDFRQTLPIIINGNRATIVDACVKNSRHWHLFRCFSLHENVRAVARNFSQWLLNVGNDTIPAYRRSYYGKLIPLPVEIIVAHKEDLITFCSYTLDRQIFDRVILTPLNETCHEINNIIIDSWDGEAKTYFSVDSIDVTDDDAVRIMNYSVEFLNSLTPTGFPLHRLKLKVGSLVFLMRNLNVRKGLCNGTRLIIKCLGNRYIDCEIVDSTGHLTGRRAFIPRLDLVSTNVFPFKFKRRQFPLRLAYAMTINKSQGQTFDRVGLYLPHPVFAHGQLYVALSRATSFEGLRVCIEATPLQNATGNIPFTRNVVYREIL